MTNIVPMNYRERWQEDKREVTSDVAFFLRNLRIHVDGIYHRVGDITLRNDYESGRLLLWLTFYHFMGAEVFSVPVEIEWRQFDDAARHRVLKVLGDISHESVVVIV